MDIAGAFFRLESIAKIEPLYPAVVEMGSLKSPEPASQAF